MSQLCCRKVTNSYTALLKIAYHLCSFTLRRHCCRACCTASFVLTQHWLKMKTLFCQPCTTPADINASVRPRPKQNSEPRWRCMCPGRGEGLRCVRDVDQGNSCGNCSFDPGATPACDCNCSVCADPSTPSERSRTPPAEGARTDQQDQADEPAQMWERATATEHNESPPLATHALSALGPHSATTGIA